MAEAAHLGLHSSSLLRPWPAHVSAPWGANPPPTGPLSVDVSLDEQPDAAHMEGRLRSRPSLLSYTWSSHLMLKDWIRRSEGGEG
jgi:hypothetical protein